MRLLSLVLCLCIFATTANATNNTPAPAPQANAQGGDASARSDAEASSSSRSGAVAIQGQGVEIIDESVTVDASSYVYEDSTGELKNQAQTASDANSFSNPGKTPCGDSSGLSAQTGVAGGGLATIPETCRAYRLQRLQASAPDDLSTKLATITHLAGWFPRLLLHVASCGVLN